jgi:ClpP class serine protease
MAQRGTRPAHRAVKPGEALAIDPKALHQGPEAFFWLFGPSTKRNTREGDVAVVWINGPLEHHDDGWGDSYEAILKRIESAMTGEDACEEWDRKSRWGDTDEERPEATPPSSVVLRIDSPGGVVSGLDQFLKDVRRTRAKHDVPVYAYVDELAASAAYAICCATDEIIVPRSGILGSVGVISTMVSQARKDAADGYDIVTVTSGKRKADGHVHVPIEDDAIAVERDRVEKLALQFFGFVSATRGLSVGKVRGLEANIYLGADAVGVGLADEVMGWRALLREISVAQAGTSNGTMPGRPGTAVAQPPSAETDMLRLDALIKRTEASLKAETDAKKRASLAAALEAYKKTKHTIEKHEEESGDEDDAEDDEEEADGNETDRGDKPEKDEDDDSDESEEEEEEEAKKGEEEEEEEEEEEAASPPGKVAKSLRSMVEQATGKRGAAAVGALAALIQKAKAYDTLQGRVALIERERRTERKEKLITAALDGHRLRVNGMKGPTITRKTAKWLRAQKLSTVESFLSQCQAALVSTEPSALPPDESGRASEAFGAPLEGAAKVNTSGIPPDAMRMMEQAAMSSDGLVTVDQLVAGYHAQQKRVNGGRY